MPTFEIDGKKITVEQGKTVLESARDNGIEIPYFCFHESFRSGGLCRMCLVEIEKMPKLQTACTTIATEGMVVKTTTDRVKQARSAMLEFILTNHPLDCPDCDQAGECVLQEYSHRYGPDKSVFTEPKQLREHIQLSELIAYDPERCIMCERCVRYYRDIVGTEELAVMQRGAHAEITTFPGKQLNYGYVGNISDICPVGALTTKDFRFKERVFNLRATETICPLCEAGCLIYADAKMYTVYRIRSRNPYVESIHDHPSRNVTSFYPKPYINAISRSSFICDDGRLNYNKQINNKVIDSPVNRLESGNNNWDDILAFVSQRIKQSGSKTAGILSPFATNEEAYAFMYLMKHAAGSSMLSMIRFPEAKEYATAVRLKLRRGVQAPNAKGIEQIAKSFNIKLISLEEIIMAKPECLYVLGPVFGQMDTVAGKLDGIPYVAVQDFKASPLTDKAHVVMPGASYAQKNGTYTNGEGKVQRLRKVVKIKGNGRDDLVILADIIYNITGKQLGRFDQVLGTLMKEVPSFNDIDFNKLTMDFSFRKAAGRLW